jgi:hypothetical protein
MGARGMREALAFIRVSTGSQDESSQERDLSNYADDPGNGIHIADWVRLHGYSASHGSQEPALRDAIAGITAGKYSVVMVTDSSRLDRREDLDAQAAILLAIRRAGGDILSITEPQFGKTDFAGRIVTLVAQEGNAQKSVAVKNSTWRGVQTVIASKASYGPLPVFWEAAGERYHKQASCTSPTAVTAVYEAIRDGQSLSSVARAYGTYPQSIRRLIRTRANFTGVFECRYTYAGQTYTWEHESTGPIVESELWHAANRVMGERGATMNNTGGRPVSLATNWISGLLPCPSCEGSLYVLRGKTLRCGGKGKDRRSCGVSGINLAYVIAQIERITSSDGITVYRFQRVIGNAGELAELKTQLEVIQQTLATTEDDDISGLVAQRKDLRERIAAFELVPDSHELTATGETLADLWRTGDRRAILRAIQRHITFQVGYSTTAPSIVGRVWIEGSYPANTLIELADDTAILMSVPRRENP